MKNVITLVTDPAQKKLDETIINKVFIAIEKQNGQIANIKWLSEGEACDIFFEGAEPGAIADIVRQKLGDLPVDIIAQENSNRKKKLLISDMDSTIIRQECVDEIAAKLGIKDKVSAITERAMNGELDFADSLRERVALLQGLDESELSDIYENNITTMPGAEELIKTMRDNDAYCLLVSGGFTFFTDKIAERLGFNENRANILEINNSKLTGKVIEPVLDSNSKLTALEEVAAKLNITKDDVLAVGDGANDLPMLKNAGLGIAYHAKENVQKQVAHRINHTSLKSLLFAQGYCLGSCVMV